MINFKRPGLAFVICAPSGTGKTTLTQRLIKEFSSFSFSISYTTRQPRKNELDGKDYYFIDEQEFLQKIDENFFAEWAKVYGNYYGTPLEATKELLLEGRDVVFDIDVQGAKQLKNSLPEAKFAFIFPPSGEALKIRLQNRQTDNIESIKKRLTAAKNEVLQSSWFDYWIINDNLETSWEELKSAYISATLNPKFKEDFYLNLIKNWNID